MKASHPAKMAKLDEIKQDLAELKSLQETAKRPKVQQILSVEVRKLETELIKERDRLAEQGADQAKSAAPKLSKENVVFTVKITDYAWDQSEKFVKLYVTLPGIHTLPPDNVRTVFGSRKIELSVSALENKNYTLVITNLMKGILPDSSYHKVKTDMVVVFLRKSNSDNWSHVTEAEKKAKEPKVPKPDVDSNDPSSSLMTMMKQMYDEGDDDMKRTIAKAWTEARDKQATGGDFGGML